MPEELCPNSPKSYLLRNNGTGRFTAGAVPGTVDLAGVPGGQPEGAQAVDINDDGRIDLYVAGHLFLNRGLDISGRVAFSDCNCGIPSSPTGLLVEEGAKFLDWNNDGKLDLILHDAYNGPQLYQNVGSRSAPRFQRIAVRADGLGPQFARKVSSGSSTTYSSLSYCASYGIKLTIWKRRPRRCGRRRKRHFAISRLRLPQRRISQYWSRLRVGFRGRYLRVAGWRRDGLWRHQSGWPDRCNVRRTVSVLFRQSYRGWR